jgi:glucose/arabinose dehydrogenase
MKIVPLFASRIQSKVVAVTLLLIFILGSLNSSTATAASSQTPIPPNVLTLDPGKIQINLVVDALTQPVVIAHAGDGSGRIFIAERAGYIYIVKGNSLNLTPYLDMHAIVNSASGEQGLLALAFHPQYETNGYFFTVHTNTSGSIVLSRFAVSANADLADFNSRVEVLSIPHPTYTNHNGGAVAFGADGYLYWSTGDGGGGGDPFNNAQNLNSLLGKVLRINVDTLPYTIPSTNPFYNDSNPSIRKEIWAYGLRNPWRISFDRLTNDMYIGDVGQGEREEIDFQPAGSSGGENYGWDIMEGSICYNAATCNQSNKVLPVAEYNHTLGCSVTGGYVYRGTAYPSLTSHYFYADYCQGRFFNLYYNGAGWVSAQLFDTAYGISTFGEDESGELYFADYFGGAIYQLGYEETTFLDVPLTHPYWNEIEILYQNGFTAGCNITPLKFCPDALMNRGQMAVFTMRGEFGVGYTPPPPPWDTFADNWAPGPWAEQWAEGLYASGLTAGCSLDPLLFCPWVDTTREQVVVFALRLKYGSNYLPPIATGNIFADLTDPNYWATPWAEQAYADGLIPSCGTDIGSGKPLFCPNDLINRGFGAYIIVKAKNLTMPP